MAVSLLDDSGVVESTDPVMPATIYTLTSDADSTGGVVVALLAVNAVASGEALDLATATFEFGGAAPDATGIIGGQQGDFPVALLYAYWTVAADVAIAGAVTFDVTDNEGQPKFYRGYVTAWGGVDSVSGAELASGLGAGVLDVAFAAAGDLPAGSTALAVGVCSPDNGGTVSVNTTATLVPLVGQPTFSSVSAEGEENAELPISFGLDVASDFYGFRINLRAPEAELVVFNCECDDENPGETLAQLRRRLLIRLGYSAQADNPPPGMAGLLDDFLISSQRYLYQKYRALRTERFFTWDMQIGTRFYDLNANSDECTKKLYPYKLSWVGVSDTNTGQQWYQLAEGIPPEFYNAADRLGIPARYEIRQCIEVFPAPDREYKLRVKGHFGLEAFAADGDQATIDSELLFLWALGIAKAHYGQADAGNVSQMAGDYLKQLVAGAHGTARYVPGTRQLSPDTRPFFIPVDGA